MKAIKVKGTDLYFGSPMMITKQGCKVPNYTKHRSLAGLIKVEEAELYFAELPIKREFLELN